MGKSAFDKFINKPEGGAKKKEKIRQEKKKAREEKNAWFEEQKRLARERRATGNQQRSDAPGRKRSIPDSAAPEGKRTVIKKTDARNNSRTPRPDRAPAYGKKGGTGGKRQQLADAPAPSRQVYAKPAGRKPVVAKKQTSAATSPVARKPAASGDDTMPLNKFIAWCGVCGRREAVDLIKAGKVTVNGEVIVLAPHRVSSADLVKVNGKKVSVQKNLVYILLNKPKDYITTTDDPEGRKTVMDLVRNATPERVFPVGRLDRNTTGVLLLTNDGEVAQRMTHPKYEVKKIYEVKLDKTVTKQQLDTIAGGIQLDDGFIQPDAVAYADAKDRSVIGIEIHSGRNRIVRRIFEKLGFKVKNLDRVMYGIFTKKNVDRGKWRFLSEKEIRLLKHLNTSFAPKKSAR